VTDGARLSRYLRRGHRSVAGWLDRGAPGMIAAAAEAQAERGVRGNVAEIGVHHGRLFILLYLLSRESERAVAVDLFSHQELNVDGSGSGDLAVFLANLRKHADDRRLVVHEGNSADLDSAALLRLGGGPFRLISIDGGHTSELTEGDLATAEGALAEGGIVILDDCFNQLFPGVCDGVHRHFSRPCSMVPFAIGANKVLFAHPAFAPHYAKAMENAAPSKIQERSFLDVPVRCLDFTPLRLSERIGRLPAWQSVKELPPARMLRYLYRKRGLLRRLT
jgi:hypothetical protein